VATPLPLKFAATRAKESGRSLASNLFHKNRGGDDADDFGDGRPVIANAFDVFVHATAGRGC
jgi:hypothetical protein